MIEEQNQGASERLLERDYPPFSEPREWTPCSVCDGGDPKKRAFGDDRRALGDGPCPECGQPPRCWIGAKIKNKHCPRPATVDFADTGILNYCGQHYVVNEIQCELQEWEFALEHLQAFLMTARLVGMGCGVLMDFLESAQAEAEAEIAGYKAEIARIWGES